MNKRVTFQGMDHIALLEQHIDKQVQKIEHLLEFDRTPKTVEVIVEKHPNHAHNAVHVHVSSPSYKVVVKREGNDLYQLVNEVVDAAHQQMRDQKEKWVDKHKAGNHRPG